MRFTINLITPGNGEKFLLELENATLMNLQGFLAPKPDLTLTINHWLADTIDRGGADHFALRLPSVIG